MKKFVIGTGLVLIAALVTIIAMSSGSNKSNTINTPSNGEYVALGDSVAAGIGLEDYSDSSACARTKQAYPYGIAKKLNYDLKNVACSGATTEKGLLQPQGVNRLAVAPQLSSVLNGKKPKLVTATIGANDTDWTGYITKCYIGTCGSEDDTAAVVASSNYISTNLEAALDQIKSKYPNDTPKVVITGYYKLFPATKVANCTELTGVDDSELTWIRQLQDQIDNSIKLSVQKYDFAAYAPIDFNGHELCSESSWIQGLGKTAVYHPTDAGQGAIGDQILATLDKGKTK